MIAYTVIMSAILIVVGFAVYRILMEIFRK